MKSDNAKRNCPTLCSAPASAMARSSGCIAAVSNVGEQRNKGRPMRTTASCVGHDMRCAAKLPLCSAISGPNGARPRNSSTSLSLLPFSSLSPPLSAPTRKNSARQTWPKLSRTMLPLLYLFHRISHRYLHPQHSLSSSLLCPDPQYALPDE